MTKACNSPIYHLALFHVFMLSAFKIPQLTTWLCCRLEHQNSLLPLSCVGWWVAADQHCSFSQALGTPALLLGIRMDYQFFLQSKSWRKGEGLVHLCL